MKTEPVFYKQGVLDKKSECAPRNRPLTQVVRFHRPRIRHNNDALDAFALLRSPYRPRAVFV